MFKHAALAFGILAGTQAAAFDLGAMTDDERTAFRAEIRAYLLANPEVIMEAVDVLEQREQAAKANND
ncbi:MAG: DsbA family protein, partial [Yoonia sp.]